MSMGGANGRGAKHFLSVCTEKDFVFDGTSTSRDLGVKPFGHRGEARRGEAGRALPTSCSEYCGMLLSHGVTYIYGEMVTYLGIQVR